MRARAVKHVTKEDWFVAVSNVNSGGVGYVKKRWRKS